MKDYGMVSIIMPCYNCANFIGHSIESILSQTYENWELLITDDCSTDSSQEIVKGYVDKDSRIRFFVLGENLGAGLARNNSIKHAAGRFIAFCDSDDRWHPRKLELQLEFMTINECAFSFTACDFFDEKGNLKGHQSVPKQVTFASLLRNCAVPSSTAMYDTSILGKIYMPSIRKRQDWALWLDIVKKSKRGYGFNETLMYYLVRKGSVSSNKKSLLKYNFTIYHEHLGYSKFKSFTLLYGYFIPAYIIKRAKIKLRIK